MKQRNKEELIKYFMELLNKNNVLENIMTNEEIENKLNNLIKNVTYEKEEGAFSGSWYIDKDGRGTVNFDPSQIRTENDEANNVVHELLHVLSTNTNMLEINNDVEVRRVQCGLHISKMKYYNDGSKSSDYSSLVAINEGMTDSLAEQITGVWHNGYDVQKDIYKLFCIFVEQEKILNKAFKTKITIAEELRGIFKEDLISKYGENLGNELNTNIEKIFYLADDFLNLERKEDIYGLNENGKKLKDSTHDKIYDILYSMIENIINNEPDVIKKFSIIKQAMRTTLYSKVRDDMLYPKLDKILNDDTLGYNEKTELFEKFPISIPDDITQRVLFKMPESDNLTSMQKLKKYVNFMGRNANKRVIYKLLVESGKISEEKFPKGSFFVKGYKSCSSFDELENILDGIKYNQIGNYYELDGELINEEGQKCDFDDIFFEPFTEPRIMDYSDRRHLKILNEDDDKFQFLSNQIKDIFKEYKVIDNHREHRNVFIDIFDNILKLRYDSYDVNVGTIREYFKLNPDGTIEKVEKEERRITDDKSKKDLENEFDKLDLSGMSIDEKIIEYTSICNGHKTWMNTDKIYEWFVEDGTISPSHEFKKEIFKQQFLSKKEMYEENDYKHDLDEKLASIKYSKIGNLYKITYSNGEVEFFDEQGNIMNFSEEIHIPKGLTEPARGILKRHILNFIEKDEKSVFKKIGNSLIEIDGEYYMINIDEPSEMVEERTKKKIYR